jgi:glycerophosphoryl diester phosphodiesterase
MLYTVNDPAVAERLLAAGVDGLFTDNLEAFTKIEGAGHPLR